MSEIFIIAEIGINHNGDICIAKKLIDMAKKCGCDAVKFQKRTVSNVYSTNFLNSYRKSPWGTTQREQKLGLEFSNEEYDEIDRYCKEKKIEWFASAWDLDSQKFLDNYNLKYNKIASPMLTNKELVEHIAKQGKKTFISLGMSTWNEIDNIINIFYEQKCPYVLMHCVSIYPCPDKFLNLNMLKEISHKYKQELGYSGHSPGILDAPLAVALGAKYIEKHITLDRAMYGSDQSASLGETGLEYIVRDCKSVNSILGDGIRTLHKDEIINKNKLRDYK